MRRRGNARRVAAPRVVNIEDLRRLARRRLPRVVFDYVDGGAEAEVTMRQNVEAFGDLLLRPRCAVLVPTCELHTIVTNTPISMPCILAPVGSTRMFYPKGEVHAARAAAAAGTIYSLSTFAGTSLEEVRAASSGPLWFQLYLCGGRATTIATLERARAAKFDGLVVTIDTAMSGLRERDVRNGMQELIAGGVASAPYLAQMLARPRWLARVIADGGLMKFPNVVLPDGPMRYADVPQALADANVCWNDLAWIREVWNGPLIIKGIQTGDDARRAVDEGADAIVVSNHGGRQLDGVAASLRVLPEVCDAVNGRIEVLVDGGVRRGSDIVKALCLGARAVLIGRAYVYGLAAAGEAGVARALEILGTDMVRTMKLLGVQSIADLDASYIGSSAPWFRDRLHVP
jgi:isopentenyl diphosphate isomerase/L-lactate dehydrogenase-like FMN-dependent dehydrogenase